MSKYKMCKCGCINIILSRDSRGRERFYFKGHVNKGKRFSEQHRKNLSLSHNSSRKYKKHTKETKEKLRISHTGKVLSKEHKLKLSISHRGHVHTLEQRKKIGAHHIGAKNVNWKGGITPINKKIRNSLEYKLWREEVFKRDKYSCVLCKRSRKKGDRVIIQADHIKPFSRYPALRMDISNGRTLCIECHKSTKTWGINQFTK